MNDPSSTGLGLGLFVWITLIPLLIVLFGRSRRHGEDQPPPAPPPEEKPPEQRDSAGEARQRLVEQVPRTAEVEAQEARRAEVGAVRKPEAE